MHAKIQTDLFEINVLMRSDEVLALRKVRSTEWKSGAIAIGLSAGAKVFWCKGSYEESISIMVAHDDETWDIAVEVPAEVIDQILQATTR